MRTDNIDTWLTALCELDDLIRAGQRVLVHGEELGDRVVGEWAATSDGPA